MTTSGSWSATLSASSGAMLLHWGWGGQGGCCLFSLHALVATALLTRVGLYVYFGLDMRTVQDPCENQWNRTWQENMKGPFGGDETEEDCGGNILLSVCLSLSYLLFYLGWLQKNDCRWHLKRLQWIIMQQLVRLSSLLYTMWIINLECGMYFL